MNYTYNIKVNLKNELINFYEWNKMDKIMVLKKVPVFKVNDNVYENIISGLVKVNDTFLDKISLSNYICIFCNDIDTICIKFDNKGKIDKLSKLDLIEEKDVLEDMRNKQKYKLEYKTIKNEISYSYNTRKENITINNLVKYIEKEKNNKEIIDYLYYEWFNKNNNEKDKYLKLIDSIKEKYSEKHDKLKKIVELINS